MTSYDTLRLKVGKRPITLVELDLDFCSRTYGVSPCTAILGTTGGQKCFNTFKTCQAPDAYDKVPKTYRFCSANGYPPIGQTIFNCIEYVDIAPTQLKPGGFSVSASVTVTMRDFPYHDRGIDPYVADRTYDPRAQGTFFGRLRGRNPYMVNRVMRVSTGYVDEDRVIYTKTRTYFVDHIEGPDAKGVVKLVGKDLLRFAEQDKAEAPLTSKGSLSLAIAVDATSFTLVPAGIGETYPASGTLRIGDELVRYTTRTGDMFTGLVRGAEFTLPDEHDSGDAVQLCLRYTNATVPAVIYDLLTTYTGIDPQYLPLTEWQDQADTWIPGFLCNRILSKPDAVKKLIEDLMTAAGCSLWWDELDAKLRFRVIVPQVATNDVPVFEEFQHILAGSLKVKDQEKERVSRVIYYLSLTSPVSDDKKENYRTISVRVDADGESANAYGASSMKEILSRWTPNKTVADQTSDRLLAQYRETPREVTLRVEAKDHVLRTGDLLDIRSTRIQNPDGSPGTIRYLVTETREIEVGTIYEYVCLQVSTTGVGKLFLVAPDTMPDWTAATPAQQKKYMFVSNDSGVMSDLQPGGKIN